CLAAQASRANNTPIKLDCVPPEVNTPAVPSPYPTFWRSQSIILDRPNGAVRAVGRPREPLVTLGVSVERVYPSDGDRPAEREPPRVGPYIVRPDQAGAHRVWGRDPLAGYGHRIARAFL